MLGMSLGGVVEDSEDEGMERVLLIVRRGICFVLE